MAQPQRKRKAYSDEPAQLYTMRGDLLDVLKLELQLASRVRFPSPLYQTNPEGFFRNVLGLNPWHKQVEIMNAVRDHKRVAVVSGHKCSKSNTCAGIALWKYCSFNDSRVVMTSTTARQVDAILWRELRMLHARAGRCLECKAADPEGLLIPRPCEHSAIIDGELGDLAKTGLKSHDFREIVGFTARQSEAVAGISGAELLYICDEASGIPDLIFEAIEGNCAGGATVLMVGNGTRNEGEFFEAFHGKSKFYVTITMSSEETPNVIEGRDVIPGLATRAWVEEKREEWGENSPMYIIRVKGGFALGEDSKIFSTHTIMQAEQRWQDTEPAGRLFIGMDPAGETGTGDDSAVSVRRGLKQLALRVRQGLTADAHLAWALQLITEFALPRETPVVVIDCEGSVGTKLVRAMRDYLELPEHVHTPPFELTAVRASDNAQRRSDIYGRMRDELVANLEEWFRAGGAIVTDAKLAKELHQYEYKHDVRGKAKVTPKDVIKRVIGRSPDRFDATALSVWESKSLTAFQQLLTPAGREALLPANDNARMRAMRAPASVPLDAGDDDGEPMDSMDALKAFR
jgi:phage terminase large subunit